jgi:hypothetical protein
VALLLQIGFTVLLTGRVPYLTTVGNHESDWPGTASIPGYGDDSGGECGVVTLQMLPMPAPATTNQPWWSYDVGLFHLVGMSTEHDFSVGSPQYSWLKADLAAVNRTLTPWVVFSGHRSMYVDSDRCCHVGNAAQCTAAGLPCQPGSDVTVMTSLQTNIEPLLYQYRVNLAFAGHFHDVERQTAVYKNEVVQAAVAQEDAEGNTWWVHRDPQATVWMVVGSAGNGPLFASINYTWSERYWDRMFGYALVSAVNATHLEWKFINSADSSVVDRMVITQSFEPWQSGSDGGGGKQTGWNSLSSAARGGIIFAIAFVGMLVLSAVTFMVHKKRASGPTTAASATTSPMQARGSTTTAQVEMHDVA